VALIRLHDVQTVIYCTFVAAYFSLNHFNLQARQSHLLDLRDLPLARNPRLQRSRVASVSAVVFDPLI
jgi:hypothetical protein